MSNVVYLSISHSVYISKRSGKIVASHFIEAEIPEIKDNRAHFMSAITIAPTISQPHIEALVSEIKSWG